jgi:hypothetical protein
VPIREHFQHFRKERSVIEATFHKWQPLYLQAVIEPLDSSDLPQLVREAEKAVSRRIHELRASLNANEERKELGHALASLRYLRNEKFKRCNGLTRDKTAANFASDVRGRPNPHRLECYEKTEEA